MKEQERPTLTLRRKTEPEGQRAVNNSSEPDGAGPGRVTRKKTVLVNATSVWKVRKQAVDESAKKAQADKKAAQKAEKARLWAERQAQEREAMRKPAPEPVYRKVMPLALLQHCWPALVTDDLHQLLAVNIREAMVSDIRQRGLDVSVKTLKRCLAAVTRSDAYLGAMTVGAWRKNLAGECGGGGVCRGAQGSGAR